MENTKRTTWIAGTVLLAVAILALTWFVLVAPVVDETATVASDTQVAEDRNTALTTQLGTLKQQFAELDTYKAELSTIEAQIPATADTSEFLRTIDTLKTAAGTNVVDVQFGVPVDVLPAQAADPAAAAAADSAAAEPSATETAAPSDTATAAAGDGTAATATPPATTPVIPGFVAIPVSVTALGNPVGVLAFLDALQQQSGRLMLVTDLKGTGQDEQEASGGRPATKNGDLELIISGYIYVLEDSTTPAPADDSTSEAAPTLPEGAPSLSGA